MSAPNETPVIPVGTQAPDFRLPDQKGQFHSLRDYAGRWVVLYFYPKDDTSGCTKQACGFRDAEKKLQDESMVVLGVSPDDEASHARFAAKYALPFPLLADEGAKTCQAYGVWQEKSMYGRTYMGVARTTYLIDPAGKVAHRWDRVSVDGHADDTLAVAGRLRSV